MGILVKPPLSVRVTQKGITNILPNNLPPGFRYRIYTINLCAIKSSREVSLMESGTKRWSGLILQKRQWRIDYGPQGYTLAEGATLDLNASGKLTMDVNILQYGIIRVGTDNG